MKFDLKNYLIVQKKPAPAIKPVRVGDHHGAADIRVCPDPAYRIMPVALIDRGNKSYLIDKDVASQLYSTEYYSAAIVTALQGNVVFLWKINIGNRDVNYVNNVIKQAVTAWVRITDTYTIQPTHVQPSVDWESLPPFADMLEAAFRGRIISSFTDPTLWK